MKASLCMKFALLLAGAPALFVPPAHADLFGTGPNTFTLDFVHIGNAGNTDDLGAGGGLYSTPYGGVLYEYRMGTFEISQEQIEKATASGLASVVAGAHTGAEPAANITWYEAAAFVNWLNTSTGHQAAYQLTGVTALTLWSAADAWDNDPGAGVDLNLYRHKAAYYFLPSEDEWYKAAYHKNDGVTANYWDYATAGNAAPAQSLTGGNTPGSAVYDGTASGSPADPADVNLAGGLSPYGTMGQSGNVREWQESATLAPNDNPAEDRTVRGGGWIDSEGNLNSAFRVGGPTLTSAATIGFRVASVPEPSAAILMSGSGLLWLARRRRGVGRCRPSL
jgi:hypothetical protein